jgi:hypothetical protein
MHALSTQKITNKKSYRLDERGIAVQFPVEVNFLFSTDTLPGVGAHPLSYSMGNEGFFLMGEAGEGMKLTTCLHLVMRLKMSGAVPPLFIYISMSCIGTTLHFLSQCQQMCKHSHIILI